MLWPIFNSSIPSIAFPIINCEAKYFEPLYVGDIFTLEDVKGIIGVNKNTYTVSKVINGTTFQVDAPGVDWNGYTSGGRIIQLKKDEAFNHSTLEEQFENPSIIQKKAIVPMIAKIYI